MAHPTHESALKALARLTRSGGKAPELLGRRQKYNPEFMKYATSVKPTAWKKDAGGLGDLIRAASEGKITVSYGAILGWKKNQEIQSQPVSPEFERKLMRAINNALSVVTDEKGTPIIDKEGNVQIRKDAKGQPVAGDDSELISLCLSEEAQQRLA